MATWCTQRFATASGRPTWRKGHRKREYRNEWIYLFGAVLLCGLLFVFIVWKWSQLLRWHKLSGWPFICGSTTIVLCLPKESGHTWLDHLWICLFVMGSHFVLNTFWLFSHFASCMWLDHLRHKRWKQTLKVSPVHLLSSESSLKNHIVFVG